MIRVVVPVSGGKDSQACLKLAIQQYPRDEVLGLFCDTKFEHPLTYEHVEYMRLLYGVRIEVVNNGSVEEQVLKHGRFPGGGSRFCTEELKIWPSKWFYKGLGDILRAANEPLTVPSHADDGGEEAEIAGVYLIADDGAPCRP